MSTTALQVSIFSPTGAFVETVDKTGDGFKAAKLFALQQSADNNVTVIGDGGTVGAAGSGGAPVVPPEGWAVYANENPIVVNVNQNP